MSSQPRRLRRSRTLPLALAFVGLAVCAGSASLPDAGASEAASGGPSQAWLPDPDFTPSGTVDVRADDGRTPISTIDGVRFFWTPSGDHGANYTRIEPDGHLGRTVTITLPDYGGDTAAIDQLGRFYFDYKDGQTRSDVLLRFAADSGAQDATFHPDIPASSSRRILAATGSRDGVLVAVGRVRLRDAADGRIRRLNADGSLDASFGTDGVIQTPSEAPTCLTTRPDGTFLASYGSRLASFNASGQPEATFGTAGSVPLKQTRSDACPVVLSDGGVAFVREEQIKQGRRVTGQRTTITRVGRDGHSKSKELHPATSYFVGLTPGLNGTLMILRRDPRPLALEGNAPLRLQAFDAQMATARIGDETSVLVPETAPLGTSGFPDENPVPLPDGQHALFALRSDSPSVGWTRVRLGTTARPVSRPPSQRPDVRMRLLASGDEQTALVRYSCRSPRCRIARLDVDGFVNGTRRLKQSTLIDTTGGTFAYEHVTAHEHAVTADLDFPLAIPPRRIKEREVISGTFFVLMKARATDGFARSATTSISYRVHCTFTVRNNTGYRHCRRTGGVARR